MFLTATYAKTLNTHLEEAARLVAPWKTVAKGIIVPMILPGIFLSAVLVFLLSLGEFSVPMFLRYDVFPVESFTQFSAFYNYSAGTAFVIPLIIIAFLILLGERRFLRDKTYQLKPASGEEPLVIKLGKIKWPLFICVVALCFVAAIMPILALIIQSATFATYVKAFEKSSDSLSRSIAYAVIGATLLTSIGVFFGYLIHKKEFS
jgi:iron(III) transport system permease protein